MGLLFILLFTEFVSAATEPTISYSKGKITATSPNGIHLVGENTEILETIACKAALDSRTSLLIPSQCAYLQGLYRFIYIPKGSTVKHQVLVDFSISRDVKGGQTFLVGDTIKIDENTYPTNPAK